jgi:hypothetical protein
MKNILKFNPKHHISNDNNIVLQTLIKNTKHGHPKLEGLLLAKKGISICKSYHACLNYNKMPKLALANGLWIGVAPLMLQKLIIAEETLIAQYWMILFKLKYTNKGRMIGQHAVKRNVISFAQKFKHAIELLNELPL